jgi:hypothetical protein
VRPADGSGELHLPSYDLFSSTEILGRLAMEKMLAGLSSRRYTAGLEPAGQAVADQATAASKSAVSRRFVAATETATLAPVAGSPLALRHKVLGLSLLTLRRKAGCTLWHRVNQGRRHEPHT